MRRFKISISIQISIFLVIVAFIPVVVAMALKTYESQQLAMLENSNVQQARIVSAALGNNFSQNAASELLTKMNGRFDSRIRILDKDGFLIADSARILPKEEDVSTEPATRSVTKKQTNRSIIYRFFSFPIRFYRRHFKPPVETIYNSADFYSEKQIYDGQEVLDALNGRYGAKTRISSGNQVSVTLYSAVPVLDNTDQVCGAVLVSRSTYKILQNIYELRLDLAKIFLRSLIVVLAIAIFLGLRISLPLKKLSRQTGECADKKGKIIFTKFAGSRRHDEIGDLSRSFSSLIEKLNRRIQFSQAFSSDISHEFKNPLTAIRSFSELLGNEELSQEERAELSNASVEEVRHLEMLLNGIRNISRIDAESLEDKSEQIKMRDFILHVVARIQKKYPDCRFEVDCADETTITIPEDYLDRLSENLIDNAASFGTTVKISVKKNEENAIILRVEDNGEGISEQAAGKIFDRFYSERKDSEKIGHTGLGLSTVKAICDSVEAEIAVGKSNQLGGACFSVKFMPPALK